MKSAVDATATLPPLYAAWMQQLLEAPIPAETEAACHDCPMCTPTGAGNRSGIQFNSKTKCCTFMPDLPNFLVGRILRDEDRDFIRAKAAFDSRLPQNLIVTPLGVNPPSAYMARYKANAGAFGHDASLRCPFYMEEEGGLCGIWKHRNARCATWFCKFVRGSAGVVFWKYMDQLLSAVEKSLARWCVLEMDLAGSTMEALFPPPLTDADLSDQKRIWGKWWGKEDEFFRECSLLVDPLTWQDVSALGGAEVHLFARLVQISYADLVPGKIPAHARVASWKKVIMVNKHLYRVWAYNRYDPLDLTEPVMEALPYFDGRPVAQALHAIAEEKELHMEDVDVLRLVDFGILEACEGSTQGSVPVPKGGM